LTSRRRLACRQRQPIVGPFFRYSSLLSSSRFQRVLGVFLLGLWVGRRAILLDPGAHQALLRRVIAWGVPIGLVASTFVAWAEMSPLPSYSRLRIAESAAYVIGVVPLALAYVAAFSLLWLRPAMQSRLAWLAPAGRMALTCYLTQTLIGCTLFYGIGLGWAGRVGPRSFPLIALVVFAVQVVCCRWWLRHYRFGPIEWVWRSMTYGKMQRMSPASPQTSAAALG
jgi:uncharacterized protein